MYEDEMKRYDEENETSSAYDEFVKTNRRTHSRKNGRKSGGFGKQAASVAALALIFGLVSGGTFQAVNAACQTSEQAEQETQAAATTAVATTLSKMTTAQSSGESAVDTVETSSDMTVQEVAQAVLPATVAINCTGTTTVSTMWGNAQEEYTSCGTGIIVGQNDTELLIATNNHVVEDSDTISVCFTDEAEADALVKGTDAENDLAVIAVDLSDISSDTMEAIAIAELGDSDDLEVGEQVVAIGNALGYGQSVTTGIVSALNREVSSEENTTSYLIQTDAAINPGNSGGALVNMQGQVIGINSAKYSDESVEGMGFAIPVNTASEILNDLMNRETRTAVSDEESSYIGIQGQDISETIASAYNMPEGIYVTAVSEDSPAEEAGIQNGDILVKFDGTSVETMEELQKLMKYYASGEEVTVTVKRCVNGEYTEQELQVTLGHKEAQTSTSQNENTQNPGEDVYGSMGQNPYSRY